MSDIQVSIFASAVRPKLWPNLFKSLKGITVNCEIIFCGNINPQKDQLFIEFTQWFNSGLSGTHQECGPVVFTYIPTANIKPSQCYEIARRSCKGEVTIWAADDCEFPDDVVGKAYRFWKSQNNEKLILSMLTRERYTPRYFLTDLNNHTLKGPGTPLMAPIGMMSRAYLERLGGADRRYCAGQYENDYVLRILQDGGELKKFEESPVVIDHFTAHGGVSTVEGNKRPFASGYNHDREILEGSWIKDGRVSTTRLDAFQPFIDDGTLLTKSQDYKGIWE